MPLHERGALQLRADSLWALYGPDGRLAPDLGSGFRRWMAARDGDAEAERAADKLTETLASLDAMRPVDYVPTRRPVQSWGWHTGEAPEPVPSWWDLARENGPSLITALAAGYLLGALVEAIARGKLP